jgi:hypothetical protein
MNLRTRLQGVAWGATGLIAGLAVWAGATGAYQDKPHQNNYQVPAGATVTTTSPAPSASPSVAQLIRVAPTNRTLIKHVVVQPRDQVDPTSDTPTSTETTTDPVPTDTMPTDDGTQGPGGYTVPPPPVSHPTPSRPGQHTPSGGPND